MRTKATATPLLLDAREGDSLWASNGACWQAISDRVMGGVSDCELEPALIDGHPCLCLGGQVSLEYNGGFIQASLDLNPFSLLDARDYAGIEIEVYGNDEAYNLHLRSADTRIVWQSYRASFRAPPALAQPAPALRAVQALSHRHAPGSEPAAPHQPGGHRPGDDGEAVLRSRRPLSRHPTLSEENPMLVFTRDPMTLNDVTDLDAAPCLIEGRGSGQVKIYFESEANKREYLEITPHRGENSSGLKKIFDEMADNPDTGSIN